MEDGRIPAQERLHTHREAETAVVAPPHPADAFWCDPREGKFDVSLRVEATLHESVDAATPEEARAKIEAMIEAEELDVYGSDIDEARVQYVRAQSPMYLIHRPGTNTTGTSRIQPGDEPREPKDDYERRTYTRPPTTPAETDAVGMEPQGGGMRP